MDFLKNLLYKLTHWGDGMLPRVFFAIILLVLGLMAIKIIMHIVKKALSKTKLEKAAFSLIRTAVKSVLLVILFLIVASSLGIDITGIVALASVVTLAISLALQNLLANVIGGFTLLYTHPFRSGDFVEIAGQSGTISEVGIAYTKLIAADNKLISIPNNAVVSAEITNYTILGKRRAEVVVSASYNTKAEAVIAALLKATEDDRILKDPAPAAVLTDYGDHAISYTLRFWAECKDYWGALCDVKQRIKPLFDEAGIEMTYPHLNVHLEK